MKDKKNTGLRIVVFVLAIILIIFMWVKKDVGSIVSATPKEQILPLVLTSVAVTLVKVGLIAGAVFFIKWIIEKIKNKKQ